MKFLIMFFVLSIVNVVFSTIRSIVTIKGGKTIASLISGAYFAFYNIMLIYTVADFPMWQKCVITFVCNVVGVYLVKWLEQKMRKDRLWQIDFTINNIREDAEACKEDLRCADIPFQWFNLGKHTKFTCYAETCADSEKVAKVIKRYHGKYFATESKTLGL